MKSLFDDLKRSIELDNEDLIKSNVQTIASNSEALQLTVAELSLLQSIFFHSSGEVVKCISELLAEAAKSTHNRELLTSPETISFLLNSLDSTDCALRIQACRGLGNICFDNPDAREIIGKSGLTKLVSSIKRNKVCDVKLETVSYGFMLNLLMENEELQKAASEENVVELVETALREQPTELCEDYVSHVLSVLNLVVEYRQESCLPESLCLLLISLLRRQNTSTQIAYYCLEIIHDQAENEAAKFFLAKEGVCELVIGLIENYKGMVDDEETKAALRMACDIIVLILTEDETMVLLYDGGKGQVYTSMVEWINSEDADLACTGILAIGNFARNDEHCVQMVQSGISKQLLELLPNLNPSLNNDEFKVQHAILSALRNLVILPGNRAKMLKENLIHILYPTLSSNYMPVIFKLLGTFRIITDGQQEAALNLLMREDLLQRIVEFYFNSDHLGVRGEACRLLAWLLKNCHSSKPHTNVIQLKDCVKCLVQMILSNHAIMQNEAFYAINMLAISCLNCEIELKAKLDKALVDADVAENVKFMLGKYKDKLETETLSNLLTLLGNLVQFEGILQHLQKGAIKDSLLDLIGMPRLGEMSDKLQVILRKLG